MLKKLRKWWLSRPMRKCCGCSCGKCNLYHHGGDIRRHTDVCQDRFWKFVDLNRTKEARK